LKVTWGLENAVLNPKTITTLGSYDGMHRGHVEILSQLIVKKEELNLERSLVITFDPHPQEVLHKNNTGVDLLTTIDERLALFEKCGVDETLVIRFSMEFAKTPYTDFFNNIIVRGLGTKAMVVGYNHAFGKNREGDTEHLKALAHHANIIVKEVPPLIVEGVSISSTKIRQALLLGQLKMANSFLGRPYELSGIVEQGDKLGRTLGYPTANLKVPEHKLIPSDGVYGGTSIIKGVRHPAAISIGTRPTVTNDNLRKVEAYILDFNQDIYGESLTMHFLSYIRPQIKFISTDELVKQMAEDILKIRNITHD
jgi:riboflavin kinase/FMN adenylyltransferase